MNDLLIVTTLSGQIKGVKKVTALGDKYSSFQRIPYAEAPINELRFSDPQPVSPWSGILDGTIKTSSCIQLSSTFNSLIGDEDCLHLNVYTKNASPEKGMPVMV